MYFRENDSRERGYRPGRYGGREELPAILCGSHFDTVPNGGCFDGLTGIMTALEAVAVMKETGYRPKRIIEIVAFINEEASQFLGGTFGSKAMCGVLPEDYFCFIEVHIEQGKYLLGEGMGIVGGGKLGCLSGDGGV